MSAGSKVADEQERQVAITRERADTLMTGCATAKMDLSRLCTKAKTYGDVDAVAQLGVALTALQRVIEASEARLDLLRDPITERARASRADEPG